MGNTITFFLKFRILFSQYKTMNNLRHKKYKNKQLNNTKVLKVKNSTQKLENNVKPIKISIIDMDKI